MIIYMNACIIDQKLYYHPYIQFLFWVAIGDAKLSKNQTPWQYIHARRSLEVQRATLLVNRPTGGTKRLDNTCCFCSLFHLVGWLVRFGFKLFLFCFLPVHCYNVSGCFIIDWCDSTHNFCSKLILILCCTYVMCHVVDIFWYVLCQYACFVCMCVCMFAHTCCVHAWMFECINLVLTMLLYLAVVVFGFYVCRMHVYVCMRVCVCVHACVWVSLWQSVCIPVCIMIHDVCVCICRRACLHIF